MGSDILILGSTGSFGGAIALELLARGRSVRLMVRDLDKARLRFGNRANADYVVGDAREGAAVAKAAAGCQAIIHGVNYPYHQWAGNMERATENVIAAARGARASGGGPVTILFPGNVYGLGAQTGRALTEDAPNQPNSEKGRLRAALEESLRAAAEDGRSGGRGGVKVIVLRAGDYFGPTVRNAGVDPVFLRAWAGKTLRTIGDIEAPHQWCYVPDLARATADLLDLAPTLAPFELINFGGYLPASTREFLRLIGSQAGHPEIDVGVISWRFVKVIGFINPIARELMELRYLWETPVILDDAKLRRLLPGFTPTPIEQAVHDTLHSYRVEAK